MILQTAQGVAASKDVLAEIFDRIGWFFARLETYTEVAPTMAMTNIIMEIMAEVIKIFGIATKELRRGSASEFLISRVGNSTQLRTEKFFRKLAGMAELEDALNKLDRLTQEEARMAHAEVLRITHSIRNEVKIVDGKVGRVEDKVEEVGDKVGGQVQCVDEKVQVVIDGARGLSSPFRTILTSLLSDGKQATLIIQHTANGIDEIKCSSLPSNLAVACRSR